MSTAPQPSYGGTALNQFSFKLRGVRWNETEWKTPELSIDMVNNNPRIVVFTNNPSEADKTRKQFGREKKLSAQPISCRMKWKDFFKFLYLMDKAIESKEPVEYTQSFKGPKFDDAGNKVQGQQVVTARMTYGQDADGCIYIKVYEKDREKCLFRFQDEFWVPVQRNGEDLTKSEDSKIDALSFFASIKAVLGPVATAYYIPAAGREAEQQATSSKGSPEQKDIDVTTSDADAW